MKALISIILATLIFLGPTLTPTSQAATVCSEQTGPGNTYYLPTVLKMAQIDAVEQLEKILRQPADFPFDGWITEVFPETVTMKLVGSNQIKRNVHIPSHISADEIELGVPARLGEHRGQPILLAILPQLTGDVNYAGKGSIIPDPPHISVVALADGWHVTWPAVPGASSYVVYRNDTPDETSVDEVGETTQTSLVVPYESPFVYFAVRSISGLNESELSGWLTDDSAPATPNTFEALGDIQGHKLTIGGNDASLAGPGFKCWEIEQANDGSGTGAASLGNFYPDDFPYLRTFGRGTVKYYRIRSIDYAGNTSDWTDWDFAYAGQDDVQDKFDGYGGSEVTPLATLWWLQLDNMESLTNWGNWDSKTTTTLVSTPIKEGIAAIKTLHAVPPLDMSGASYKTYSPALDLSVDGRFTDDDYVIISAYLTDFNLSSANTYLKIRFTKTTDPVNDYYEATISNTQLVNGWNHIRVKKSDFVLHLSGDWSHVERIYLWAFDDTTGWETPSVVWDDIRIVKADPDDATTYNDTGPSWDRAASTGSDVGEWHIYEGNRSGEPSKPYSYGQIKTAANPSMWYLSHKPFSTTNIFSGTIQSGVYLKDNDGMAGLSFFIKDVSVDSWDMYVIEADSAADTITLAKYVGGTRTQIAQASFTFAPDQILWLGADFKDYQSDAGRIKVYASLVEGNLIQAANLVISSQDTEWISDPGGSVGLLSYQANVRFVSFVAGSPEHAEVADVARSLDGPIITGEATRLWLRDNGGNLEQSADGTNFTVVGGNHVPKTSTNRPGVTKLYRRDDDTPYNIQIHWDGVRWVIQGYYNDSYHAPARVAYADVADVAAALTPGARGSGVNRNSNYTGGNGGWYPVYFNSQHWGPQGSGPYWDGSTAIYATRTGWHIVSGCVSIYPNDWPNIIVAIGVNGGVSYTYPWHRLATSSNTWIGIPVAGPIYLSAGNYVQLYYYKTSGSGAPTIGGGSLSYLNLVEMY